METIIPKKLKSGSHIRVIAPSRSLGLISAESKQLAIDALSKEGFIISFGKHVDEIDNFNSSSIESRVSDLHEAFADPTVDGILTVIGGYNSNQLLNYLDYDLIKANPKYLCGFSDITVLNNAIYAKTGIIGCNGPHFSSWGMKKGFEYSIKYFKKCCMENNEYNIEPSLVWSDDPWYLDQDNRDFIQTKGFNIINNGEATGTLVGGHVRCLSCLQGTQYFPSFENSILLLEEDEETNPALFDRLLQSFIHLPEFKGVKGIIIGRFQNATKMTPEILKKIISSKKELKHLPIISDVTIGHTTPIATFPIGGTAKLSASPEGITLTILSH